MSQVASKSLWSLFGRVFWMLIGPLMLAIMALRIMFTGDGWLTIPDLGFLLVLLGMLLGRYVEFRGGDPRTVEGEPATPEHLRRYVWMVLGVGVLVWVVANLLGNHVLAGAGAG